MSRKIGEALVAEGLVSPAQLDRALKSQLILGGHLGTCLIELGYIDEEAFGHTLAATIGFPYAEPALLRGIPPQALQALPRKVIERYMLIPFRLEGETLHVAAIDPRDLYALSSSTGYRIVPWVAPEIRVFEALELYYGIPRRARYLRLARDRRIPAMSPIRTTDTAPAVADRPATITPAGEEPDTGFAYGRSWRDLVDEASFQHDGLPTQAAPAPSVSEFGTVAARLARADDKESLATAIFDYTAPRMANSILFSVRSDVASPWAWRGPALDPRLAPSLRFPIVSGSLFALMLGDGRYRGPVPERLDCRWIFGALGIEVPAEVLLVPAYLDDRLVAVLYGDSGPGGPIEGETESYVRIAQKLGLAISVLVLRLKIRSD